MRRNTLIGLAIGIGLIGLVLLKNVLRLNQRIEEDNVELRNFENSLLTLQFPKNLVRERDTTYLESGEVFCTVDGVAGSSSKDGHIVSYTLSVATYSERFTTKESFSVDSLKRNLNERFANGGLQLLRMSNIDIQGIRGLKYVGLKGRDFEKTVMFTIKNNVIAINMKGADSANFIFDDIIKSVKIKKPTQQSI